MTPEQEMQFMDGGVELIEVFMRKARDAQLSDETIAQMAKRCGEQIARCLRPCDQQNLAQAVLEQTLSLGALPPDLAWIKDEATIDHMRRRAAAESAPLAE